MRKLFLASVAFGWLAFSCLLAAISTAQADSQNDCTKGEPDEMLRGCTKLIDSGRFKGPSVALAYNNRGVAKSNLGDREGAIADYSEALRIDPRSLLARVNRARNLAALGRYQEAITDVTHAIKLTPRSRENYALRAEFNEGNGTLDAAQDDYREAIKRSPSFSQNYFALGKSCYSSRIMRKLSNFFLMRFS